MFVKKKGKMIIGVVAVILCVSIILFSAQQFINPYRSVSEVTSDNNAFMNQRIQMIGNVVNGSIQTLSQEITFTITDETFELNGVYSVATPQNFIEGGEVVISGRLISGYTFEANQILTKCPSKFLQGAS